MQFYGALIEEQGVKFGIVVVKPYVLNDRSEASAMIHRFAMAFGGVPVVLMAQDTRGVPTYLGRPDIVRFLANLPIHAIPWREYTVN